MTAILDLGRRGVLGLLQGQLIGTLAGAAFAAVGLIMASPLAGLLSQLEPIAFAVRLASVGVLAALAGVETRPMASPGLSGWPQEGVLLFGAGVIFTAALSATFVWLLINGAVNESVQITFAAMLVPGNVFLGAFAWYSYLQRDRR